MRSPAIAPAVLVDGVSKSFRLPHERVHTLKERVLHPLRRSSFDDLRALNDVSFAVEPGEFFGIVGRNGSGKSTLLKCLAGIYASDAGEIYVNGRMSTFIELGVGFNPDLAARDNVVLNATMLGLSAREARERFDEILAFAELEEFVELKIKNYSSGMLVRLAFSVMIQVDASILLIDEVLAVGDAAFQQKCFDEFERIRSSGRTVLLVTHDMGAVRRFCTRALLLEHGRVVANGDPEEVGNRYLELNFSETARAEAEGSETAPPRAMLARTLDDAATRLGDGRADIIDAFFTDERGDRAEVLRTPFACGFCARVSFHDHVEHPDVALGLYNSAGTLVFTASTALQQYPTGEFTAGEEVDFRFFFGNLLEPDRYAVTVSVRDRGGAWIDLRDRFMNIMITGTLTTGGLVQIPYDIGVHRYPIEQKAAT
ncbi:MAG: type transport system ATP-binding protein [Solirubrobacteraceae bacterium]